MIAILRGHAFSIAFMGVVFAFFFVGQDKPAELFQLSGFTMGTSYTVQLVELPESTSEEEIAVSVSALLETMDKGIFSTYAADSELSRLNRHPALEPFSASHHLFRVLQIAESISEQSNGAFDVTVAPLVNAWGFGPVINPEDSVPDSSVIQEKLLSIGYKNLVLNEAANEVTKSKPLMIDLSAIAKGYAVDQLAEYFDNLGVANYFLEIGGELKIKGLKPGEKSWIPAIEAPIDTQSQVYKIFFSRGETIAVAGSGDYRNYFEKDGVRYSHEIDPRTGYPVTHNLAAVSVIDESAAKADALATAFMVLGFEQSKAWAEETGQAAFFIYKQGDGFGDFASSAFQTYLEN